MPMTGYFLQTGGSARRRVIKPRQAQAYTDTFPTETQYNVTGVPGHTHNSSAVISVLCDMSRKREIAITTEENVWSEEKMEMTAEQPGDKRGCERRYPGHEEAADAHASCEHALVSGTRK